MYFTDLGRGSKKKRLFYPHFVDKRTFFLEPLPKFVKYMYIYT